jgi:hypothetical protein
MAVRVPFSCLAVFLSVVNRTSKKSLNCPAPDQGLDKNGAQAEVQQEVCALPTR